MKKLLFVSPELPYPAHSGGKLKSLKLLQHLAQHFEVSLVCPLKLEDEMYVEEFLAHSDLKNFLSVPVNRPRSARNLAYSYIRNVPLNVYRSESESLKSSLNSLAEQFDLVFIDHFEAAQYIPERFAGHVVYHAHNTYHQTWARFAERENFVPHRIAATLEACRVRAYESSLCNSADLVFAAPNDIISLRSAGATRAKFRETYHLGSANSFDAEDLSFSQSQESLLYVGYLGWEPNAAGLLWFIDHVWPRLKKRRPALTLRIAGKNPDQRLIDSVDANQGIELLGYVDNLETVFQTSRVNIAPLQFGSGMKVKVLDAMARGLPTATTPVGIEGIVALNGVHAAVCQNAADMAVQIEKLLCDPYHWLSMSRASRRLVRHKYSWEPMLNSMTREIAHLGGTASKRSSTVFSDSKASFKAQHAVS